MHAGLGAVQLKLLEPQLLGHVGEHLVPEQVPYRSPPESRCVGWESTGVDVAEPRPLKALLPFLAREDAVDLAPGLIGRRALGSVMIRISARCCVTHSSFGRSTFLILPVSGSFSDVVRFHTNVAV